MNWITIFKVCKKGETVSMILPLLVMLVSTACKTISKFSYNKTYLYHLICESILLRSDIWDFTILLYSDISGRQTIDRT